MKLLYPELDPYQTRWLEVEAPHKLCVEESGSPDGIPVLFLHGGPGSGCSPYHRQFFDPSLYRIVLFDQRGSGRSTPCGELGGNHTGALIEDIELIRERLGIDRWVLFGGSWGATLALVYAETHPQRISGLILRGTFLGQQREVDWFFKEGANRIFPDCWQEFTDLVPPDERVDLVAAYHRRIISPDAGLREAAARGWSRWTGRVATYTAPEEEKEPDAEELERMVRKTAVECHYAVNRYFLTPGQILESLDRLSGVPVTLVHGRADLTCTLESSWSIHRQLPESILHIVAGAGHLANEPSMIDALIEATDDMSRRGARR